MIVLDFLVSCGSLQTNLLWALQGGPMYALPNQPFVRVKVHKNLCLFNGTNLDFSLYCEHHNLTVILCWWLPAGC